MNLPSNEHHRLPEPGEIIADKYVVEQLLGRGGMGAVYVVNHRVTGKRLALKCLLPEYLETPEIVERFLREAQAVGRIQHRHVVDVFDVGRDGSAALHRDAAARGQAAVRAAARGQLSARGDARASCCAPWKAWPRRMRMGIVHRDLKPDNIFVCVGLSGRLDDPRVLDFGISKLDDDSHAPAHQERRDDGHAPLHVLRAAQRPARSRPARRRVRDGRHPLRSDLRRDCRTWPRARPRSPSA